MRERNARVGERVVRRLGVHHEDYYLECSGTGRIGEEEG
ncbi:hypothetical protein A2U01_0067431, partial [Trifolium medium]|nr:hypothetical protein [Trifolium medium]